MPFKLADAPQWKLTAQSPIIPIENPAKDDCMGSGPSRAYCSFSLSSGFNQTIDCITIAQGRMNLGKSTDRARVRRKYYRERKNDYGRLGPANNKSQKTN